MDMIIMRTWAEPIPNTSPPLRCVDFAGQWSCLVKDKFQISILVAIFTLI